MMRVRDARCARRTVLRAGMLAILPAPWLVAAASAPPKFVPPRRRHGGARVDVRGNGARGDGVHDDTAAFQRAIDALPDDGGTVEVPGGRYLIDPVRRIRLRSRMHLKMAPDARLVAKANAAERSYVLLLEDVEDVEVSGGRILGDRDRHLGSTGEWGYGIAVRGGSRITLSDVYIARCWGDGLVVGGLDVGKGESKRTIYSEDVVVAGVTCTGNRRQGLTIGGARRVRVHDCEFSDTHGTAPEFGIDVEPDKPRTAQDVLIENCLLRGNRGGGIQLYWRTRDIAIRRCTIERNRGYGILAVTSEDGVIAGNRIRDNGLFGIRLRRRSRDFRIVGNTFSNNATRSERVQARHAKDTPQQRLSASQLGHIETAPDTSAITIADNRYLDA